MTEYIIYKIEQNDDPTMVYIGITNNFSVRKSNHKKNCKNKVSKKYKYPLYQYMRALGGFEKFTMSILEKNIYEDRKELLKREKELITLHNAKLNTI